MDLFKFLFIVSDIYYNKTEKKQKLKYILD